MNAAYLSTISALAGSIVGGLTSGLASWLNQRSQARAGLLAHEISRREDLYKDFIIAASKAYGQAVVTNEPQIQDLIALYAMISRMRVLSSRRTIACADQVMHVTIRTYPAPNRTIEELDKLIRSGAGIDPLKEFSEAARDELRVLTFNRNLDRL
jgi:hypothetical protein